MEVREKSESLGKEELQTKVCLWESLSQFSGEFLRQIMSMEESPH